MIPHSIPCITMEILRLSQLSLDPEILATPWLEDPWLFNGKGWFYLCSSQLSVRFQLVNLRFSWKFSRGYPLNQSQIRPQFSIETRCFGVVFAASSDRRQVAKYGVRVLRRRFAPEALSYLGFSAVGFVGYLLMVIERGHFGIYMNFNEIPFHGF